MGGGGSAIIREMGEINSSAKGLFRLAQLTGQSSTLAPGACKRCGQVGHLFFQCRNTHLFKNMANQQLLDAPDDAEDDDPPSDCFDSDDGDDDDDDDDDDDESDDGSDDESSEDSSDS